MGFTVSKDIVQPIAFSYQAIFTTTSLVLSVSVLIFGVKLSSTIDESAKRHTNKEASARNRTAARRTIVVSMLLASIWLMMTCMRGLLAFALLSSRIAVWYYKHRTAVDGTYYSLKCSALLLVLLVYGPFRQTSSLWLWKVFESWHTMWMKIVVGFCHCCGVLSTQISHISNSVERVGKKMFGQKQRRYGG